MKFTQVIPPIFKVAIDIYATNRAFVKNIIFINICEFVCNFVNTLVLNKLYLGEKSILPWYLLLQFSLPLFNKYFLNSNRRKTTEIISRQFRKQSLEQYSFLSFDDKRKYPIDKYINISDGAGEEIRGIFEYEITNIVNKISLSFTCLYTFWINNLLDQVMICIFVNALVIHFYLKGARKDFYKERRGRYKQQDKLENQVELLQQKYEKNEKYLNILLEKTNELNELFNDTYYTPGITIRVIIEKLVTVGTTAINLVFLTDPTGRLFILCVTINYELQSLIEFYTNLDKYWEKGQYKDYSRLTKIWNTSKLTQKRISLPFNDKLTVLPTSFERDGFKLILKCEININKGEKIIFRGNTGSGKTTLLNELLAKTNYGIKFREGDPSSFCDNFTYMQQDMNGKYPLKTSLRDLFDNAKDNEILTCLKIGFPTKVLTGFLQKLKKDDEKDSKNFNKKIDAKFGIEKSEYDSDDEEEDKIDNPYDVPLQSRISGGEKSCLCTSLKVFEVYKYNTPIFVLDEPDQGVDTKNAMTIITQVFKAFPEKTIILVTHLCTCKLAKLKKDSGIIFNKKYKIVNGILRNWNPIILK